MYCNIVCIISFLLMPLDFLVTVPRPVSKISLQVVLHMGRHFVDIG